MNNKCYYLFMKIYYGYAKALLKLIKTDPSSRTGKVISDLHYSGAKYKYLDLNDFNYLRSRKISWSDAYGILRSHNKVKKSDRGRSLNGRINDDINAKKSINVGDLAEMLVYITDEFHKPNNASNPSKVNITTIPTSKYPTKILKQLINLIDAPLGSKTHILIIQLNTRLNYRQEADLKHLIWLKSMYIGYTKLEPLLINLPSSPLLDRIKAKATDVHFMDALNLLTQQHILTTTPIDHQTQ